MLTSLYLCRRQKVIFCNVGTNPLAMTVQIKPGILLDHLAKLRLILHKTFSSAQKISQFANEEVFITQMPKSGPDSN